MVTPVGSISDAPNLVSPQAARETQGLFGKLVKSLLSPGNQEVASPTGPAEGNKEQQQDSPLAALTAGLTGGNEEGDSRIGPPSIVDSDSNAPVQQTDSREDDNPLQRTNPEDRREPETTFDTLARVLNNDDRADALYDRNGGLLSQPAELGLVLDGLG